MKTEKRPFHCLRQSLTGWIGTAAFLAWGGLAAPAAPQVGVSGPAITVLEPDEGPVGTEVVIRGENFGPSIGAAQGTSGMSFGGVWASPSTWSEGEVRVEVPAGATTGPVVVTVSGVGSEGLAFTVTGPGTTGPAVGTVSPAQGAAGTEVVIRGENFGPPEGAEQGTAGVSFNGVAGTPASWSEAEIRVAVPEGATAGPVVVTVGGQVSNGVGFTVTAAGAPRPSIVSVSPAQGAVGTEVVIRGGNFGDPEAAAQGTRGVSFSGVWAEPSLWSEAEIRVAVPEGAPSGLVVVAVEGEASDGVGFAVAGPAPVIATVDPTHGPEGTGVVIRGEHFGSPITAAQGRSGVSFNGVWGVPTHWSGTEIRAAVPEGVASGLVAVTVGGQASNGVEFTVTAGGKGTAGAVATTVSASTSDGEEENSGPAITSLSPEEGAVGASVTVTGTGFGAAQGNSTVSFNGVAGVPTSWSETAIQVPVPEGAASGPVVVTVGDQASPGVPFRVLSRLTLTITPLSVSERPGDNAANVEVSVPSAVGSDLAVALHHPEEGTVDHRTDYSLTKMVVIPQGSTLAAATLAVGDDTVYESDETVEIRASARGYGDSKVVTVALRDNDEPLTLTVTPLSRSEGEGERTAEVTVSVEEPAEGLVRVFLVQQGGNADRNTDYALVDPDTGYALVDPEVWIQPGDTSVTTTLEVIDDTVYEEEETVVLLASTYGYDYADSQEVTVTIEDDDPRITGFSPDSGLPGDSVTISGDRLGGATAVTFAQGDNRVAASSFTVVSDTEIEATVPAGATTGAIEVTTPAATAPSASPFTVLRLFLATSQSRVAEPNGTATLTVSVLKAVPTALTVTLDHPGDGNADPATDYTLSQTVVTIGVGNSSATVELTVTDDASYEKDETIEIRASAEGYLDSEEVTVTLESEDPPPLTLTVDPLSLSEREGERTATVTVSVEEPAEGLVRVFLVQQGGNANSNTDYALVDNEVWIQPAGTLVTTTLEVIDDAVDEEEETVVLLASTYGPDYADSQEVTVRIEDDDTAGVTVTPTSLSLTEEGTGTTYQVRLDSKPTHTVTITIDSDNPDLEVDPASLSFGPGNWSTPQEVTVAAARDDGYDDESGTLTHGADSEDPNYEGIAIDGVTVAVDDDELPPALEISVITHQHGGLEVSHLREGEPAYRTFAVTVSVPEGDAPTADTTITLTSGGTASSVTDYTLAETVTLGVGERSVETPLTVTDDDPFEAPETLTLQATDPRNDGYRPSPVVTVTIYDDNRSKLTLSADASSVSEPDGTVRVTASVEEGKELATDATVFLGFGLTRTATHKTDFRLTKRLTLPAERNSVSTVLTVLDDVAYEGDERIELLASGDGTSALSQSEILTILLEDDDPAITGFTPKRGGAGVVVTISGDNLVGATAVRFGEGETSEIEGDSDAEIRATVPAGATTGPITVVTPAGTATSTGIFTVRQLYLEVDPASVGEAAGQRTATVKVRVNEAVTATEGLTVTLAHPGMGTGKATRDTDYTLVRTVTIANTKTSAPVATLTVVDDGEYEGDETILLQATASDYGASREVTVTVEDDDPTITDFTPTRGAPGVVVTISGDNFTEQGTTVQFNGVEVEASKVTVDSATEIQATVPPGATTGPITVKTPGGTVTGADPFRVLRLHIQVDPATVEEKAGERTAMVTVSVDDAVDQVGGLPVTFTFGGTADRGRFEDYTMDETVTITAGNTSAEKTLTVRDDRDYEEEETITIQAGAEGYEASEVAEVALLSDDLPELDMSCPLSLSEEAAGTENILVYLPFTRDGATVVSFAFKGTATRGTDYAMDQTVTIGANESSASVPLTVIDDRRHEGDETIDLEVSADGYQTAFCVFSIEDTDPVEPPLTLSVSPASVGEASGRRTATVTVSVDEAVEADTPVTFTFGGTADRETDPDYTMDQTVTILNTNTSASTTLTVIDDAVAEGDETITITAGATDYSDSEAVTVTIADDDVPGVTVTEASLSITEGKSGTYQVKLDTQPTADVTITVASSDEGAVTVTPASLTFTAGNWNTARAVTVEAVHDEDIADETATLTHVAAGGDTNYAGIAIDSVSVSVTDDEVPGLTVTPTSLRITEGSSKSYQVKLDTQPLASVSISMSSNNSDVQVPSTALTFTTETGEDGGWDRFQSVRVRIAQDDNNTDESGTITHGAESDDMDYDEIAVSSVSVSVSDDDEPNQAPVVEERISNMTLTVAEERTIALSPYFSDPDGDSLRYSAISSATSTVTAEVDNAKDTLTVTGVAVTGSPNPTVTVTASDGNLSASQTFSVTVEPETPTLTSNKTAVSEPSDTAEITVTVPTAVSAATTFSLSRAGSADSGTDYTLGSVTIQSDKTKGSATLRVRDDTDYEGTETITLRTAAIAGAYTQSNELTINLNDNEPRPPETPEITSNKTAVSEPSDTAEITVTVPTAVSAATTFSLSRAGSADSGTDYTLGSVTIQSDKTKGSATLRVRDDTDYEGTETITLRTAAIAGAYTQSNELTINLNDNEPRPPETPEITSNKTAVSEPSDTAEITVTVPTAVSAATTFSLSRAGSADSGTDYTLGSVTIQSDKTKGSATLRVRDDTDYEGTETITLRTAAIAGAYTQSNELTINLNDNEPRPPETPEITSNKTAVSEPSDTAEITVTVPTAVSAATTFSLSRAGSADSGTDYTLGSVTIQSDKTEGSATLRVRDDTDYEGTETITLRTAAIAGAYTQSNELTINLNDNEPRPPETPEITSNKTAVSEPSDTAEITVTVPTAVSAATTFSLSRAGSADSGTDYTLGSVTIQSDKTKGSATLRVRDDTDYEGTETITLRTAAIAGAYTQSNELTINLNDNEPRPPETPEITSNKTAVSEPSDTAEITVTVPTAVSAATTFSLSRAGSADSGTDYTLESVTIQSDKTKGSATLRVRDDTDYEGTETITLRTAAIAGAYTQSNELTINLNDNEPRPSETPEIYSIRPGLQRPDDPVAITGNHFGTTAGSVSFSGHTVGNHNFTGSNPGYSWSNTSIRLLIPGSIHSGPVTVTVTAHNGGTSEPYPYTVTGGPVQRGECDGEEDCPEEKEKEESEDSGEGEEDPAEGG